MKKIVPLTLGPGGERIGEAEVDFDNPAAPTILRFTNARDAEIMADLIQGKIIDSLSIEPNRKEINDTPILPPEMRDTLGVEIEQPRIKFTDEAAMQLQYPKSLCWDDRKGQS